MKTNKKISDDMLRLIAIDIGCILIPSITYIVLTITGTKLPSFFEFMEPYIMIFIIFLIYTIVYYPISKQLDGLFESIMRVVDKLAEKQNEQKDKQ